MSDMVLDGALYRAVGAGAAGEAAAGPKLRAQKILIKNNLTKISAYASFLGNDSLTRPTSTCTIDIVHGCSDKFHPTKAFSDALDLTTPFMNN